MKKILFIVPEFLQQSTGGLEKQARIIIENLKHMYSIDVLCFGDKDTSYKGVNIHTYTTKDNIDYSNHLSKINSILLVKKLREIIPDMIIIMDNSNYLFFILNSLYIYNKWIPLLISISTHPELFKQRVSIEDFLHITSNNYNIRVQLESYTKYYRNSIVIGNYSPHIFIDTQPKSKQSVFVCSNLDDDNKGFSTIYEYYHNLYIEDKLLVFGMTRKYTNTNNVTIYPITKNISDIYSTANVYISNSTYEGISNSALEAYSLNIPILCNSVCDGVKFLIENNGYIYTDFTSFKKGLYDSYDLVVNNKQIDNNVVYKQWDKSISDTINNICVNSYNCFDFKEHKQGIYFYEK